MHFCTRRRAREDADGMPFYLKQQWCVGEGQRLAWTKAWLMQHWVRFLMIAFTVRAKNKKDEMNILSSSRWEMLCCQTSHWNALHVAHVGSTQTQETHFAPKCWHQQALSHNSMFHLPMWLWLECFSCASKVQQASRWQLTSQAGTLLAVVANADKCFLFKDRMGAGWTRQFHWTSWIDLNSCSTCRGYFWILLYPACVWQESSGGEWKEVANVDGCFAVEVPIWFQLLVAKS